MSQSLLVLANWPPLAPAYLSGLMGAAGSLVGHSDHAKRKEVATGHLPQSLT